MKSKKIVLLIPVLTLALSIGAVAWYVTDSLNTKALALNGGPSYDLNLNKDKNKLTDSKEMTSGETIVKTGLNNDIHLGYEKLKDAPNNWQVLEANGSIYNIDPINGITSFRMNFFDDASNVKVYYSPEKTFDENKFVELNKFSYSTTFYSERPNYFKIVTGENKASIDEISISFNCINQYTNVDVSCDSRYGTIPEGISGIYESGSTINLTIDVKPYAVFKGWYINSQLLSDEINYEYHVTNTDVKIKAVLEENIYTLGTYPQTKVTDETLINDLTQKVRPTPTSDNKGTWLSYDFYIESVKQEFTYYKDVEHNGEKYRAVYFNSYRPWWTDKPSSESTTVQDTNGYLVNNIYFFRFEPIEWKKLDNAGMSICEKILDAQQVYYANKPREVAGEWAHPNNYKHSEVRAWLNNDFYNLAFATSEDKANVKETLVKNDASTTGASENRYCCEDTLDNVYLPSRNDMFNENLDYLADSDRQAKCTDYAACLGAMINKDTQNSCYWTRSPDSQMSYRNIQITYNGVEKPFNVYNVHMGGIRPMITYQSL